MPSAGGGQQISWRPELFDWIHLHLIVVEGWPYYGTDFTGDPYLPLPEGEDWDEDLGKTHFLIFMSVMIFFNYVCLNPCICRCLPKDTHRNVCDSKANPS